MFKLSKLETRTQEIVLLLTLVSSLSFIVGGILYLYLSPQIITTFTGNSGTWVIAFLFNEFGYSTFSFTFGFFLIGNYIIVHYINHAITN